MTENMENFKKLLNEIANDNHNHNNYILLSPYAYKKLMEATDKSFLGKLKYGWRLFVLSYSDWRDAMYSEDYVEEFFEYLGNCGVLWTKNKE